MGVVPLVLERRAVADRARGESLAVRRWKLPDLPWVQAYYLVLIEAELVFALLFLLNRV